MQFIKEFVPDKRWQTGQRPIIVESNFILWLIWKFVNSLEVFFRKIKNLVEKSFKIIDNIKEENNEQQ